MLGFFSNCTIQSSWILSLNDEGALSMLTALVYLGAGGLSVRIGFQQRREQQASSGWFLLGLSLLMLGVNKEADFHSLVYDYALGAAKCAHLPNYKRWLPLVGGLVAVSGIVVCWLIGRRFLVFNNVGHRLVIMGLSLLVLFGLVRLGGLARFASGLDFGIWHGLEMFSAGLLCFGLARSLRQPPIKPD
jgi:hypothetical protein